MRIKRTFYMAFGWIAWKATKLYARQRARKSLAPKS